MKRLYLLIGLILIAATVYAVSGTPSGTFSGGAGGGGASECTGYLICQNFETATTGYDHSESWTESIPSGGVVEAADTTATVLRGSQQLNLEAGDATSSYTEIAISETSDVWVHFKYKITDTTTATTGFFYMFNGTTQVLKLETRVTSGGLRVYHDSASSHYASAVSGALSANTAYHIWIHYVPETGEGNNDGIATVYCGESATRGEALISDTAGTSVAGVTKIRLNNSAVTGSYDNYFDQVYVDNAEITNVSE